MATTWNPSDKHANVTLSNGNLTATAAASSYNTVRSTTSKSAGKWYYECTLGANPGAYTRITGLSVGTTDLSSVCDGDAGLAYAPYYSAVTKSGGFVISDFGATAGDVIGVALDADNDTASYYKNGVQVGATQTGFTLSDIFAAVTVGGGFSTTAHFSAADLSYAPPSGYSAWDAAEATTVTCDTRRLLVGTAQVGFDTSRRLSAQVTVGLDTVRSLVLEQVVTADTLRALVNHTVVDVDTYRLLDLNANELVTVDVDTARLKAVSAVVDVDTYRRRSGFLSSITRLSIGLNNQTLADTYVIEALSTIPIDTVVSASFYNWPFSFTVKATRHTPPTKRHTVTGDFDISELLKRNVAFSRNSRDSGSIMGSVAGQVGKTLRYLATGHGVRRLPEETTIMQVLELLYSWTTAVPNIMVNVFLRGTELFVVERGMETSVYTPVNYSVLSESTSRLDTLMDTGMWAPEIIGDPTGEYTHGTFSFGSASITYNRGYVVSLVMGDGSVTLYTWGSDIPEDPDEQRFMLSKSELRAGAARYVTTTYTYAIWKGERYLQSEYTSDNAVFYSGSVLLGGIRPQTLPIYKKVVEHAPVGSGFYGSFGIEETWKWGPLYDTDTGELVSPLALQEYKKTIQPSQVSEGRPGGAVTPRALSSEDNTPKISIPRTPIAPAYIPVTDIPTLIKYYSALAFLDGKLEHKKSIRCFDAHAVDYTERVLLDGHEWFFDGGTFEFNSSAPYKEQIVNLVRWE